MIYWLWDLPATWVLSLLWGTQSQHTVSMQTGFLGNVWEWASGIWIWTVLAVCMLLMRPLISCAKELRSAFQLPIVHTMQARVICQNFWHQTFRQISHYSRAGIRVESAAGLDADCVWTIFTSSCVTFTITTANHTQSSTWCMGQHTDYINNNAIYIALFST